LMTFWRCSRSADGRRDFWRRTPPPAVLRLRFPPDKERATPRGAHRWSR
jgi:hypothetical protein